MRQRTTQSILGIVAVLFVSTSSFGQLQRTTWGNQEIIIIGAQVYDGITIRFELEQVPLADNTPNLPAYKLQVSAQVNRLMNHSFLSHEHQNECQSSTTSNIGITPKSELLGIIKSCIVFSNQVRPIYQFIYIDY
jgi:hypothetical protein